MEDRFKRRIYDKANNKFYYDFIGFVFNLEENTITITHSEFLSTIHKADDIVIQGCTGLKDKNGTLIYEGDICKNVDKDFSLVYGKLGQIRFNQNNCCCDWKQSGNWHGIILDTNIAENIEIIGNIYENKDLLNA